MTEFIYLPVPLNRVTDVYKLLGTLADSHYHILRIPEERVTEVLNVIGFEHGAPQSGASAEVEDTTIDVPPKPAPRKYQTSSATATISRLLSYSLHKLKRARCSHPPSIVTADILEGDFHGGPGGDQAVQWCRRCGSYRRISNVYGDRPHEGDWIGPPSRWMAG